MSSPSILVVDDDKVIQSEIVAAMASTGVTLVQAFNLPEALDKIRDHFLAYAFVDMFLPRGGVLNAEGMRVIRELKDLRPTCKIVSMTELPDKSVIETYALMRPQLRRTLDALLSKADATPLSRTVCAVAAMLKSPAIVVGNIDEVHRQISLRLERWRHWQDAREDRQTASNVWPVLRSEEVSYLVSAILRSGSAKEVDDDTICGIDLIEQGGGKSSSAVFKGNPYTRSGHRGNLCIFKFGPRPEIEAEYRHYNKFVRYYRGTYRRVEALGYADGDCIGVICYSFAGPSPDGEGITSIQQYFEGEAPVALDLLDVQLNPARKEWYLQEAPLGESLTEYFAKYYHLDSERVVRRVRQFVSGEGGLAAKVGGRVLEDLAASDWIVTGDDSENRVRLPVTKDISSVHRLIPRPRSCITHGDLNAGNILVAPAADGTRASGARGESTDARVITIDYRHTRRGPIFIDFAALEASARLTEAFLSTLSCRDGLEDIVGERLAAEERVWIESWNEEPDSSMSASGALPYWATVSRGLIGLARGNFERSQLGASREEAKVEYAATCLLYALRLLRIEMLAEPFTMEARLSLICWMSQLLGVLRSAKR